MRENLKKVKRNKIAVIKREKTLYFYVVVYTTFINPRRS